MNTLKIETNKSLTNFFNKFNVRNNPVVNIDDKLIIAHILENKIDSVSFSINNFSDIAPILNDNKQFSRNWIFLILGLVVLIIGIAFYFKFSKKPVILFSEFEKQFLKKLLSKSGKQLDIDSLNYLLGLSKKSVEIQKKNRSEFLNKLDQKLRELLNTEDVLIIRVKDESDKRIFLYQLNEAFFDQINKLV
jgi:mRNA-degrading endonuclease YafQ of YafQ-DinJ toxin-antitoxin module